VLSDELLARLERSWIAQDAPLLKHLRPGLTDDEITEVTAPLGLSLPSEAVLWWRWHDGVGIEEGLRNVDREVGPGRYEYLPLEQAARRYEEMRAVAEQAAGGSGNPAFMSDRDYWWHPSWFPIAVNVGNQVVTCDCSVRPGSVTPIRVVDWHDDAFDQPKTPSFGRMVEWWIEALENGTWRYDAHEQRWVSDASRLSRERDLSRLV
jgi:cell wall assembly regulator SMI1